MALFFFFFIIHWIEVLLHKFVRCLHVEIAGLSSLKILSFYIPTAGTSTPSRTVRKRKTKPETLTTSSTQTTPGIRKTSQRQDRGCHGTLKALFFVMIVVCSTETRATIRWSPNAFPFPLNPEGDVTGTCPSRFWSAMFFPLLCIRMLPNKAQIA